MALLEAMAAGVPVIATRVGGVPDVVSESEAFLVPDGDAAGIALAMDAATLDDQTALVERAGRRLTSQFALDPWLATYEELYREMTQSKVDR